MVTRPVEHKLCQVYAAYTWVYSKQLSLGVYTHLNTKHKLYSVALYSSTIIAGKYIWVIKLVPILIAYIFHLLTPSLWYSMPYSSQNITKTIFVNLFFYQTSCVSSKRRFTTISWWTLKTFASYPFFMVLQFWWFRTSK